MLENLIILKTDIESSKALARISPILNEHRTIRNWNIDLEDSDRVLRLQLDTPLSETHFVELLQQFGIQCEPLPN